jgi:ribonuclease E
MAKRMLIDATQPEETRVAVVSGTSLEEYDFETATKKQIKGNIYLAKVVRVEPSLQAAFVEYGGNRHGFLAFSEIHPDYYRIPVEDRAALVAEEREMAQADDRIEGLGRNGEASSAARERPATFEDARSRDQEAAGEDELGASEQAREAGEEGEIGGGEGADGAGREADVFEEVGGAIEPPSDEASDAGHGEPPQEDMAAAGFDHDENAPFGSEPAAGEEIGPSDLPPMPYETGEPIEGEPAPGPAPLRMEGSEFSGPEAAGEPAAEVVAPEAPQTRPMREAVEMVGGDDADVDAPRRRHPSRHYKIQEVIKRRQVMLVQVTKEERGTKGAALTTRLSLAGRYCVLMPNTGRGGGISRKITSTQDRQRLREVVDGIEIPEGISVIVRTAGASRNKAEIKRDFDYLLRTWSDVREVTLKSSAPALIHEEGNLIKRSIRDLYARDMEDILLEGEEAYKLAKEFMRTLMPSHAKRVKLYRSPNVPLFQRFQIESQIAAIHEPLTRLKSGGYIVINQTEALVAIDVNSGKSTRERNIEETATQTNLEAADEVARQLRLRDLAGLIVIDFIDMESQRNQRAVEKRLKDAMKNDRARIQLGRISHFGLLELSRQRLRPSLHEFSTERCPHCQGMGLIRSTESTALQVLRALEEETLKKRIAELVVYAPPKVALYILNQKRAMLTGIETRHHCRILVNEDEALVPPDFRVEVTRQRTAAEAAAAEEAARLAAAAIPETVIEETEAEEPEPDEAEEEERREERQSPMAARPPAGDFAPAGASSDRGSGRSAGEAGGEGQQKRRRRGKRGGRRRHGHQGSGVAGDAPAQTAAPLTGAPLTGTPVTGEARPEPAPSISQDPQQPQAGRGDGQRHGRRGRRRRGRGGNGAGRTGPPSATLAPSEPRSEPRRSEPAHEPPRSAPEPSAPRRAERHEAEATRAPGPAPESGKTESGPKRRGWWQRLVE